MKTILSFSFCFFVALTVCGQDMRDTAWAGALIDEGTTLMNSNKYTEALAKFDTARSILDASTGEKDKKYFHIKHRTALIYQNLNEINTAIELYKHNGSYRFETG